jgi:hypothetical protein
MTARDSARQTEKSRPEPENPTTRGNPVTAARPEVDPALIEQLREIAAQIQPKGIAPAGNRVITARDLAHHLGGTQQWWERHRQRLVDARLLIQAGRKHVGDLRVIQEAISDPALWPDLKKRKKQDAQDATE